MCFWRLGGILGARFHVHSRIRGRRFNDEDGTDNELVDGSTLGYVEWSCVVRWMILSLGLAFVGQSAWSNLIWVIVSNPPSLTENNCWAQVLGPVAPRSVAVETSHLLLVNGNTIHQNTRFLDAIDL